MKGVEGKTAADTIITLYIKGDKSFFTKGWIVEEKLSSDTRSR